MNRKPKILFIMHMPPPMHGAAQMGQYIHDSKLITNDFECKYFNPSASANVKEIGKLNLNKVRFLFNSLGEVGKIADEWKPDLVYITPSSWDWGFYRDYLTVRILKKKGCKVVAHYHNKGVGWFMERWYNKILYASFFKNIKTVFLTKGLSADFQQYLKSDQIYICPNGIERLVPENDIKLAHERFNFMFLSNMMEEKGVLVLLEACRILREKGLEFRCTYVGKWSDVTENYFNAKLKEYALTDCVSAVGAKYGADKVEYFQKADCFVFPTFYHGECFPLVLLEAMSFGVPCISTNEGGIPDLLDDGINGFVVERKNEVALADAMARMLNDKIATQTMGQRALEKYNKKYTLEKFERNMYNILQVCLK